MNDKYEEISITIKLKGLFDINRADYYWIWLALNRPKLFTRSLPEGYCLFYFNGNTVLFTVFDK